MARAWRNSSVRFGLGGSSRRSRSAGGLGRCSNRVFRCGRRLSLAGCPALYASTSAVRNTSDFLHTARTSSAGRGGLGGRPVYPFGQQERGGEQENAGQGDRGERAGEGGEDAPDHHQCGLQEFAGGTPCAEDPGGVVRGSPSQAFGRVDRVEDAHAGDQQALDDDHGEESGHAGLDERETEREERPQPTGDDHDPVPAVAGHEARGEAGAHEAAECRDAEGETVLPGREVVLAQQEDGQERGGGHDQAADQYRVEEQAPQYAVAEDEPPAGEQVGGRSRVAGRGATRRRLRECAGSPSADSR